jgi:hypothetical protein
MTIELDGVILVVVLVLVLAPSRDLNDDVDYVHGPVGSFCEVLR